MKRNFVIALAAGAIILIVGILVVVQRRAPRHLDKAAQRPLIGVKTQAVIGRYGAMTGDSILSINGTKVTRWSQIGPLLSANEAGHPLNMEIKSKRTGKTLSLGIAQMDSPFTMQTLGIEDTDNFVGHINWFSLAAKLGLKPHDRLLMVQGQPPSPDFEMGKLVAALKVEKKLQVDIVRGQEVKHFDIPSPKQLETSAQGLEGLFEFLGIDSMSEYATGSAEE